MDDMSVVLRLAVECRLTLEFVAWLTHTTSCMCVGLVQVKGVSTSHYTVNINKLTMLKKPNYLEKTVNCSNKILIKINNKIIKKKHLN